MSALLHFLKFTLIIVFLSESLFAQGPSLVADIEPGTGSSIPSRFFNYSGKTYFAAITASTGRELFESDLTSSGTSLSIDTIAGPTGGLSSFQFLNGKIVYSRLDPNGFSVHISDGTQAGTVQLASGLTYAIFSEENTPINGILYFIGGTSSTGAEFWRTDGTAQGTYLVKDLFPGSVGGTPSRFTQLPNDPNRFILNGGIPNSLWVSDGTSAGTVKIFNNIATSSFTALGNQILFCGLESGLPIGQPNYGLEIWRTDGTAAGTLRVTDQNPGLGSFCGPDTEYLAFNGYLYLSGDNGTTGLELWRTDGTAAGTTLVSDIFPGAASSDPKLFTAFGSRKFYFVASGGPFPKELFESDGTAAGTFAVTQLAQSGTTISLAGAVGQRMGRVKSKLAFTAHTPGTGQELWNYHKPRYAMAVATGSGCGNPGQVARCSATDPVVGGVSTVRCENIPVGAVAFLILGSKAPYPQQVRPGCFSSIDLSQPIARLDTWTQASGGAHQTNIPIPNQRGISGLEFTLQLAMILPASNTLALSGGVDLLIGTN